MEYYSKCNVCGKITCYTDSDLKENHDQAVITGLAALSTLGNAVAGTKYDMYENSKLSDRASSKIVDYSKCPNCGSKDLVLVTKKFAIFSNKVNGNYSIDDLTKQANSYLDKGDFENAFCFATMILNEDEKNYNAYLIRFLSSYEVKSLEEIDKLDIDFRNQHFDNLLFISNDAQKEKLLKSKYNYIFKKAKNILEKKDSEDLIEELEYWINELDGYEDEKSKNLLNKLVCERNEIIYEEGCEYLNSEDISNFDKAINLFEKINDYKDSKKKLEECKAKLKHSKNKHKKTALIMATCIAFIILGIIISNVIISNKENKKEYDEAINLYEEKEYKKAYNKFKDLGNYKDSKEKATEVKNEEAYTKATESFNNGNFYSALDDFKKLKNYKDSEEMSFKSELYYNILSNGHAQDYFDDNVSKFKLINDESKIKEIITNTWLMRYLNISYNYDFEYIVFNSDGTGVKPDASSSHKTFNWEIKDGEIEIDDGLTDKYALYKIDDDAYVLYMYYYNKKIYSANLLLVLENSNLTQKLDIKREN